MTQTSYLYMSKQLQVTYSDPPLLPPSPAEVVWIQGHKHRPPKTCVKDRKFYPACTEPPQVYHHIHISRLTHRLIQQLLATQPRPLRTSTMTSPCPEYTGTPPPFHPRDQAQAFLHPKWQSGPKPRGGWHCGEQAGLGGGRVWQGAAPPGRPWRAVEVSGAQAWHSTGWRG